jgi:hypothetical protein
LLRIKTISIKQKKAPREHPHGITVVEHRTQPDLTPGSHATRGGNMKRFTHLFAILMITATGFAADFSGWSNSASLLINTTPAGGNVAGNVVNFPLLVRLEPGSATLSGALAGGADLRFSKADGVTPLPYQIERWSASAAETRLVGVKPRMKPLFR